jgi:hypothetical protein
MIIIVDNPAVTISEELKTIARRILPRDVVKDNQTPSAFLLIGRKSGKRILTGDFPEKRRSG